MMDAHTLELLEFNKVRELVASFASSAPGKRRAAALHPLADTKQLREAIGRTTEMVEAIDARLPPPLGGFRDVEQFVRRASLGVLLEVDQFLDLREVLELTGRAYDYWLRLGTDYPLLEDLLSNVRDQRHLVRAIDAAMDDRGKVRPSASIELGRIRAELGEYEERIQAEIRRLLRSDDIRKALRYPQPTMSGDHHVLPVAVNHRHKVIGVVHRTSSTGETVYIEPAKVAEISAEMSVLKSAEQREIRRILRKLSDLIRKDADSLLATIEILAELDFTAAKAEFSRAQTMSAPQIAAAGEENAGRLYLPNARHPLLAHLFKQQAEAGAVPKEVVPVSVHLGAEFDLLIITGPNTGGKTVALKTVGLLSLMALSGLHIPAGPGCQVPMLTGVLADIGDEQSLEQSLSTFSAHISRIAEILRQSGPTTLVLLDEVGAGTEPSEGAALGRAILDELRILGCRAMVTTHLNDLKTYALNADRTENAAMEFDANTLRPTYRLVVGQFGQSCALKIARRLKLPPDLLKRARRYLHRRRSKTSAELERLQGIRQEAEAARTQAIAAHAEADRLAAEWKLKTENLRQEAGVSAELEKARQALRPGDSVRVARFGKAGTVVRVDVRRRQAAVTVGAVEWALPLDELIPLTGK